MRISGALLAALCLLTGCAIGTYSEGTRLDSAQVGEIRAGITTRAELLDWFGPPANFSDASLLEELILAEENDLGGAAPRQFSDILAWEAHEARLSGVVTIFFNMLEIRSDSDLLVVFFDDADVVKYHGFRESRVRE